MENESITMSLDEKDRMLLDELTLDARRPVRAIAKCAGVPEQLANYRIKRFIKNGMISGFIPRIRADMLGMGFYRCLFRFRNRSPETRESITNHFLNEKSVYQVISTARKADLAVIFAARDAKSFFEMFSNAIQGLNEDLYDYQLAILVDSFCFRRRYLSKKADARQACIFEGNSRRISLGELDKKILRALIENARNTNREIAKKTGISSGTVRNRINSMEKKGIIQGYSAFVHPMAFGALRKRIFLHIKNPGIEKILTDFASKDENITFIARTIGPWNYELNVECTNEREYKLFLRRMKEAFLGLSYKYSVLNFIYNYPLNLGALL